MRERGIDKALAAIAVLLLAAVWLTEFIVLRTGASASVAAAIVIVREIIQLLVLFIVVYDAWQFSANIIYRLILLIVTTALIIFALAVIL